MSDSGWVREYRKITEWGWYKHLPTCHLFRHLIIRAQYKDGEYRGQALQRGQLLTGRKQLAFETGLSEQQIKTALSNLQKTGEITSKATNAFSIITICNYSYYQDSAGELSTSDNANEQPATTPTSNQQSTSNQPHARKKEGKKDKKKEYPDCPEAYRLAVLLLSAIRKWKPDARVPDSLKSWEADIDRMIRIDNRTPERIEAVLQWLPTDDFWPPNILSGAKLRKQFDKLETKMGQRRPQPTQQNHIPAAVSRPHPLLVNRT
jgi:hypothetical protein